MSAFTSKAARRFAAAAAKSKADGDAAKVVNQWLKWAALADETGDVNVEALAEAKSLDFFCEIARGVNDLVLRVERTGVVIARFRKFADLNAFAKLHRLRMI